MCCLICSKHVKDMGLGVFLVQQHGLSKYGNRVKIQMPDAEGQGGAIECTCDVPARFKLPCQDVMAALTCESLAKPHPGVGPCSTNASQICVWAVFLGLLFCLHVSVSF